MTKKTNEQGSPSFRDPLGETPAENYMANNPDDVRSNDARLNDGVAQINSTFINDRARAEGSAGNSTQQGLSNAPSRLMRPNLDRLRENNQNAANSYFTRAIMRLPSQNPDSQEQGVAGQIQTSSGEGSLQRVSGLNEQVQVTPEQHQEEMQRHRQRIQSLEERSRQFQEEMQRQRQQIGSLMLEIQELTGSIHERSGESVAGSRSDRPQTPSETPLQIPQDFFRDQNGSPLIQYDGGLNRHIMPSLPIKGVDGESIPRALHEDDEPILEKRKYLAEQREERAKKQRKITEEWTLRWQWQKDKDRDRDKDEGGGGQGISNRLHQRVGRGDGSGGGYGQGV